jgi:hypothetical protein
MRTKEGPMRPAARCLAAPLAVLATGCFSVRYGYDGPALLTTAPTLGAQTLTARHFEAHDRQLFLLAGLLPVGEDLNGAELAAREVGDHDGVVNLRLSDGQDWLDIAITQGLCVLSLLCGTWSVWAEGDVVDFVSAPLEAWLEPTTPPPAAAAPVASPPRAGDGP